jgi:hypothetical protein
MDKLKSHKTIVDEALASKTGVIGNGVLYDLCKKYPLHMMSLTSKTIITIFPQVYLTMVIPEKPLQRRQMLSIKWMATRLFKHMILQYYKLRKLSVNATLYMLWNSQKLLIMNAKHY